MVVFTKEIGLIFLCLFSSVKLKCENKKKYFIESEDINISNLKNIIKIPDYTIFNTDIASQATSFLKRNIINELYKFTDIKEFLKTKKLLLEDYKKNLISKDDLKINLINNLNKIKNQHMIMKFSDFSHPRLNIYSEEKINNKIKNINNCFQNIGFLDSVVTANINFHKNYVSITYNINEGDIYHINSIKVFSKITEIKQILTNKIEKYKLKSKTTFDKYKLEMFKNECITKIINSGYYNFGRKNLKIYAYKNSAKHNVDVFLHIDCNKDTHKKYTFGDMKIKYDTNANNEKEIKKKIIYSISEPIKKKVIYRFLDMKNKSIYKKKKLDDIYARLLDTDLFKSIDILTNTNNNSVDTSITLVLKKKCAIKHFMEIDINTSNISISNNLSFLVRNVFKHMEILTTSIEYSKTIPYKIKDISFFNLYEFNFTISANYPFSIIFSNLCNKTKLLFSLNKKSPDIDKKKEKSYISGELKYLFKLKKNIDLEFNLNFLNIEKNKNIFTQTKSISVINKLNIKNIYLHDIFVNFYLTHSNRKYIIIYEVFFNKFYRKNLNLLFKIEYSPSFLINLKNNFKIHFNLKTGSIFSIKGDIKDSLLFQLGGNEILKAWDLGQVGPGYKKTGKGCIMLAMNSEFKYEINHKQHILLFLECGNIWTKKKKNILTMGDFIYNWIIFKQLYVDSGISLILIFGILKLKFDLAIKIYSPNAESQDIFKIRLNIIK